MENNDLLSKSKNNEINTAPEQEQHQLQEPTFRQQLYGRWAEEGPNLTQLKKNQAGARLDTKNRPGEFSLLGAGLSMTFLTAMEDLEADRNQASRTFFAPVLEKAKYLARYSHDDASCAENLAQLLSAAMHYLKERKHSVFSGQRNRRRATCHRIVDEITRFLYDAPAVYAEKIKEVMEGKRRNGRLPEDWKQFQKQNAPELNPAIIEEKQARDAILSGDTAADLKKRLEMLDMLTGEMMPQNPGTRATPQEKKKYRDRLSKDGLAIVLEYSKLVQHCDELLNRGADPDNPDLQENARKLKRYYIRQMRIVEHTVGAVLADRRNTEPRTWKEALYRQSRDYREELNDDKLDRAGKRIDLFFGISELLKAAPGEGEIRTGAVLKRATEKALRTILGAEQGQHVNPEELNALPVELLKKLAVCTPNQFILLIGGIYDNEEKDQILASYTQFRNEAAEQIRKYEKMRVSNAPADRYEAYDMQDDQYRAMRYVAEHPGLYTPEQVTAAKNRMKEIDEGWVDTEPSKQQMIENLRPEIEKIRGLIFTSVFDLHQNGFDLQAHVSALASCRYIKTFAELKELELPEDVRTMLDTYEGAIQTWWPYLSCVDSLKKSGAYDRLRAKGADFAADGSLVPGISMQTLQALKNAAENDEERGDVAEWEELLTAWKNIHAEDPARINALRKQLFEKDQDDRSKEAIAKTAKTNIDIYREQLAAGLEAKAAQNGIMMQNAALKDHIMSIITSLSILQKKDFMSCKGMFIELSSAEKAIAGQPLSKAEKEKLKNGLESVINGFLALDLRTLSVSEQETFTEDLESKYAMITLGRNMAQFLSLYEKHFPEDAKKQDMTELYARSAAMNEVENVYDAMGQLALEPDSEEAQAAIRYYSFGRDELHDVRKVIGREKNKIHQENERKRIALEKARQERERLEREKREREERERKEALLKLGESLDQDWDKQREMEEVRKEHIERYKNLENDWHRANMYELAQEDYKKDIRESLLPFCQMKEDAINAFMAKPEKTEEDFLQLYETVERLDRYQALVSSHICMKEEIKPGRSLPLPYFALYDLSNINKLKGVYISFTDMRWKEEELKSADRDVQYRLRQIRKLHDELQEKNIEKIYKEEGDKRNEAIDHGLSVKKFALKDRIKGIEEKNQHPKAAKKQFEKLSVEEQRKKAYGEALKYRKFYKEEVHPVFQDYALIIKKYEYYLKKEKTRSPYYELREEGLKEHLDLLKKIAKGEDEDSIAVRDSKAFQDMELVKQINREWSNLLKKCDEDKEYLDYAILRDTGALDKLKEQLFDESELKFSEEPQTKEKETAVCELMEAGAALYELRQKNTSDEEIYKKQRAISEQTDQMMKQGLKMEDLTKEQYDELKLKAPIIERKLYTDYISRNRYALKKETNDVVDYPELLMESCDIQVDVFRGSKKKLSVKGVDHIKNDALLPGFDGDVYRVVVPGYTQNGVKDFDGFMLQNPQQLKVFNNLIQGGPKNNYLAYHGTCGPSSASHVINQLYGMNVSNENMNVHLVQTCIKESVDYYPDRDEKGEIGDYAGKRINVTESGGTSEESLSAMYDFYNIRNELYFRDVNNSKDEKTYVDAFGVDLDLVKMAEELDKGNMVQVSINTGLYRSRGKDPRDNDAFFDNMDSWKKVKWIDGKPFVSHWICLCGAVYDTKSWYGQDKPVKRLSGFLTKNTGNGLMEFLPVSVLQLAYRGRYGGGSKYQNDLIVQNSSYIVCHKPEFDKELHSEIEEHKNRLENNYKEEKRKKEEEEEEERKRIEAEEKQKKISAYLTSLQKVVGSLSEKKVKTFFETANKEFDCNNEEWLKKTAEQREQFENLKNRYIKVRDNKKYAELRKEFISTKREGYKKKNKSYQEWVKQYDTLNNAFLERIGAEYGMVNTILERCRFEEVCKEVNAENLDLYLQEWLSAAETKDYDLENWIAGYMQRAEKVLELYYTIEIDIKNNLPSDIAREGFKKNARYQTFNAFRKSLAPKYDDMTKKLLELIPKEDQEMRKSVEASIAAHATDIKKIEEKCRAKRKKRTAKKEGKKA